MSPVFSSCCNIRDCLVLPQLRSSLQSHKYSSSFISCVSFVFLSSSPGDKIYQVLVCLFLPVFLSTPFGLYCLFVFCGFFFFFFFLGGGGGVLVLANTLEHFLCVYCFLCVSIMQDLLGLKQCRLIFCVWLFTQRKSTGLSFKIKSSISWQLDFV